MQLEMYSLLFFLVHNASSQQDKPTCEFSSKQSLKIMNLDRTQILPRGDNSTTKAATVALFVQNITSQKDKSFC